MATGFSATSPGGVAEELPQEPQLLQAPSLPPPQPGAWASPACTRPSLLRQRWGM